MRANTSTIKHEASHEASLNQSHDTTHETNHDQSAPGGYVPEDSSPQPSAPRLALLQRAGVRQLVKFCLVGASSTVIDQGVKVLLLSLGERFAPGVPWWIWVAMSFCLAVTNGYFWNRKWTFQATSQAHGSAQSQYRKFVLTNAIGLALNLGFTKLFLIVLTRQVTHDQNPDKWHVVLASLCAVPVVVIWNFCAAKFWTFKKQ